MSQQLIIAKNLMSLMGFLKNKISNHTHQQLSDEHTYISHRTTKFVPDFSPQKRFRTLVVECDM